MMLMLGVLPIHQRIVVLTAADKHDLTIQTYKPRPEPFLAIPMAALF